MLFKIYREGERYSKTDKDNSLDGHWWWNVHLISSGIGWVGFQNEWIANGILTRTESMFDGILITFVQLN